MEYYDFIVLTGSYLIGAIPTSVWVSQIFYNKDIRNHGSGNAGATNTFRILGWKAGLAVLLFDIFKGWAAVQLAVFSSFSTASEYYLLFKIGLCVLAVIGHIYPVYNGFKGGKGVATLLGAVMEIHFFGALICLGIFVIVFILTNYVSLGSISGGIAFPFLVIFVFNDHFLVMNVFSIAACVLLLITHYKNITRLVKKSERKTYLFKKNGVE